MEPESISYITVLEDWEISPNNLKLLNKKLGAGQFGVVKKGQYTPANGDPVNVAVKMLKGTEYKE